MRTIAAACATPSDSTAFSTVELSNANCPRTSPPAALNSSAARLANPLPYSSSTYAMLIDCTPDRSAWAARVVASALPDGRMRNHRCGSLREVKSGDVIAPVTRTVSAL